MRNIYRLARFASLWLAFSVTAMAADLPPVNPPARFGVQPQSNLVSYQNGPKLQQKDLTGTVSAVDEVYGRISVQDARGSSMDFPVDSNTPIVDHNLQIGFADLRAGDHVVVHYNVDPPLVNGIEKI